jgi:glycosyltransferase involved in cell wall biosynthesis
VPPSVSIAIPTFNRARTLERAVRSALEQSHRDLEVVVSDNASTDDTAELLARMAAADPRIRFVRQPENGGMVANLDAALALTRGAHVMLLADDDWLAPGCVEATLGALTADPRLAAALGGVSYMRDGERVQRGQPAPFLQAAPAQRVRAYFSAVHGDHGNSWMYALVRRGALDHLSPLRNVLGFDWLRVAELAFVGPIAMIAGELMFRELGGTSETTARNVRESRLPALHARAPHLVIAAEVMAEIGWRSPVYAPAPRRSRLALAATCALGVPGRNLRHVAFHLAPRAVQRRWHART